MKTLRQELLFCQVLAKSSNYTRVFTSGYVFGGKSSLSKVKGGVLRAGYRGFGEAVP
jgi:hypothetical protein